MKAVVFTASVVDSEMPKQGPAAGKAEQRKEQFAQEVRRIGVQPKPANAQWKPGDAPGQAATRAVQTLAKAGTLGIIGVYPQTDRFFPIATAMNKNLTINMGNCNHRTYIPKSLEMVEGGTVDATAVLSQVEPMSDVIAACKEFDLRRPGWIKVELKP
ncbi:hypothetical protein ACLF3G_04595 [Falsiroseomonas sp. HC035]|uniref:hypothetical protein n=1 Tax=Falsiroseomonas sp. HC035 TaxID=3390999 RepID=UPI003D315ABC